MSGIRFPWLHVVSCCLILAAIFGFFGALSFLLASPVVGGKVGGIVVPSDWEAGVHSHGKVYEWYMLTNHPVAFVAYLAMLILSAVTNSCVRAEIERAKVSSAPVGRIYWIADAMVQLVVLAFVTYLLFFSVQIVG